MIRKIGIGASSNAFVFAFIFSKQYLFMSGSPRCDEFTPCLQGGTRRALSLRGWHRGGSVRNRRGFWSEVQRGSKWHCGRKLAAYSCGGSHGFGQLLARTEFPFDPQRGTVDINGRKGRLRLSEREADFQWTADHLPDNLRLATTIIMPSKSVIVSKSMAL
jgi:hypothetical protein